MVYEPAYIEKKAAQELLDRDFRLPSLLLVTGHLGVVGEESHEPAGGVLVGVHEAAH